MIDIENVGPKGMRKESPFGNEKWRMGKLQTRTSSNRHLKCFPKREYLLEPAVRVRVAGNEELSSKKRVGGSWLGVKKEGEKGDLLRPSSEGPDDKD